MLTLKRSLLTVLIALSTTASLLQAGAVLTTNAADYSPNSAVGVSGSGWVAGETVSLLLQTAGGQPPQTFQATANGAGAISTTVTSSSKDTYYLTGTGA